MTLTDAEKRQARATDSRAAELLDRLDDMPPQMLERMHGAIRYLRSAPAGAAAFGDWRRSLRTDGPAASTGRPWRCPSTM